MTEEKFGYKGGSQPAWPMQTRDGHETFNTPHWGLTKREYFALHILSGLANNDGILAAGDIAESVKFADALLVELEK